MFIQEIWRYPVKSTAGERMELPGVSPVGTEGDRVVQLRNRDGTAAAW
jgi:uncharacterized protein YcbX